MKRTAALLLAPVLAAGALAAPSSALAWGNAGHRMVGEAAAAAFPKELPAFLRTRQAIADLGELSRELDRSKGSGKIHDHDRDAAHFVDMEDDGRVLGGVPFEPLQATRADYETALRAAGQDSIKAGYLQFAIVDRWQQLVTDFAYWRVLKAAEANPRWKKNRAWYAADRRRREVLILRDLGELSHLVADGSQPMHVSVHYNGWGDYPNPRGYSTARLHGPFEGDLVRDRVDPRAVAAQVAPPKLCGCRIEERAVRYLQDSNRQVIPFFELEKAGGFAETDPRGPAFAAKLLAVGASELRDVTVEAWNASLESKVGWKPIAVKDVLDGKVEPFAALYGVD